MTGKAEEVTARLSALGHTVKSVVIKAPYGSYTTRIPGLDDVMRVEIADYRGRGDVWVDLFQAETRTSVELAHLAIETLDSMARARGA